MPGIDASSAGLDDAAVVVLSYHPVLVNIETRTLLHLFFKLARSGKPALAGYADSADTR